MCTGFIGGATSDPPIARATSPTTPRLSRITVVQMLASVYSGSSLCRASRSFFPSFSFSACHCCTMLSDRFGLRDTPLRSRERADSILSRVPTERFHGGREIRTHDQRPRPCRRRHLFVKILVRWAKGKSLTDRPSNLL